MAVLRKTIFIISLVLLTLLIVPGISVAEEQNVESNFVVSIEEPEEGDEIRQGENITIEVDIENEGEEIDTQNITFEVDKDGDIVEEEERELSLKENQIDDIVFSWDTDGVLEENVEEYNITVASDDDEDTVNIFLKQDYNLTIEIEGQGSTEPEEGLHVYLHGNEALIEAEADEGWAFSHWEGDEVEDDPTVFHNETLELEITDDTNVTAVFERFADGFWEEDDGIFVWFIENWYHLNSTRRNFGDAFILNTTLNRNTDGYDELVDTDDGWDPIGDEDEQFEGIFLGYEYEFYDDMDYLETKTVGIEDLYIDREDEDYVGLFGYIGQEGMVVGSGLKDVDIEGKNRVGAVAGMNEGHVSQSFSTGTVTGEEMVGGLVGRSEGDGGLFYTYSKAEVEGSEHIGGLVGRNKGSEILESFSVGEVNGEDNTGGLVGSQPEGDTDDSFWDVNTSEQEESAGGEGKTTEEMYNVTTFEDAEWLIEDVPAATTLIDEEIPFNIVDGRSYPFFPWVGNPVAPEVELDDLESAEEVYVDEYFELIVDVENIEEDSGGYEYEVVFYLDGDEEGTVYTDELSGGDSETVDVNISVGSSGEYDVEAVVYDKEGNSLDSIEEEDDLEVFDRPEVETGSIDEIGDDYAVLEGEVTEMGMEEEVRVFFRFGDEDEDEEYWGESAKQDIEEDDFLEGDRSFQQEVSISNDTEYGYKAVVEWNDEESTGDVRKMTPDSCEYRDWENKTCGGWECEDDEIHQVRKVTKDSPGFCEDTINRCVEDEEYCSEPGLDLELEWDIVNVTQGEHSSANVTVENTGTVDLDDVELKVEGDIPEEWFSVSPDELDIDQDESKDFVVNFTPSSGAPVDKYSITYTAQHEDGEESVEGELWVGPDEEGEEEIKDEYDEINQKITGLAERLEELTDEDGADDANTTLREIKSKIGKAEGALEDEDFVSAKVILDGVKQDMLDLEEEIKKIERGIEFPWFWVGLGIGVIILGSVLTYLLLPPEEGYSPGKGYSGPGNKTGAEKAKEAFKKLKEKVAGEEEGYRYKG